MKQLGIMFVFAVFAAACGGDDGGGGGGSFGKASDAIRSSIHASCAKAYECKSSYDASMHNDTAFEEIYGTSEQNCYDMTVALVMQFGGADYFDKYDAAVAGGTLEYNADDASTCIEASAGVTCDVFFDQNGAMGADVPACETTFVGTVATGGACTFDEECAADADSCDDAGACNP